LVRSQPSEAIWRVQIDAEETSAAYHPATSPETAGLFVCGPSAGGHMADDGMLRLAEPLRGAGLGVVTFDFLYRRRGNRRPDPMPDLQRCFSAVVTSAIQRLGRPQSLILGGRSMGGRIASMLAAGGFDCDALLLLAYPLHPAGEPERLRASHLPRITVPTLCFNGTRDRLCRQDLMEAAIAPLGTRWTMHWVQDADHSFAVLRSSERTTADVMDEIGRATRDWLAGLS
jgi:predicted alpha/beta-hydrolase family hydrolase